MLYESLDEWKRHDFGPVWREALTWVESSKNSLEPGTWEGAGYRATVFDGQTLRRDQGRYEFHRVMADVQVVLRGEEDMYIAPATGLTPAGPYDPIRDTGFFQEPARLSPVRLVPGLFALLFPWDGHMPSMAVDDRPTLVRKLVVKIPMDTLRL